MKKFILILGLLLMLPLAGCKQEQAAEFIIETIAMQAGYDMRHKFEWTPEVDRYYNYILDGKISLDGAQLAESYIRKNIEHPLLADRFIRIAGLVGFDIDDVGHVVGVDKVKVPFLQVAAKGFRMGLLLAEPLAEPLEELSENLYILSVEPAKRTDCAPPEYLIYQPGCEDTISFVKLQTALQR